MTGISWLLSLIISKEFAHNCLFSDFVSLFMLIHAWLDNRQQLFLRIYLFISHSHLLYQISFCGIPIIINCFYVRLYTLRTYQFTSYL